MRVQCVVVSIMMKEEEPRPLMEPTIYVNRAHFHGMRGILSVVEGSLSYTRVLICVCATPLRLHVAFEVTSVDMAADAL